MAASALVVPLRPGSPPRSAAGTAGLASRRGLGGLDREDAGTSRPRFSSSRVARGRSDRLEAETQGPDPVPTGSLDEERPPPGPKHEPNCGQRHSGS